MPVQLTKSYHFPGIFQAFEDRLASAQSTRHGGISKVPFKSLNLGLNTEDDPASVQENRRRFFSGLGFSEAEVAGSRQVHGERILTVETPGQFEGYDALITDRPGIFLTVAIADCAPVLIFDPVKGAVAAVHAGWRGTAAGISGKTIRRMMEQFRSHPGDCRAFIGVCIDECTYEVDADVADRFPRSFRRWDGGRHKFFLDLKAANKAQLLHTGVPEEQIEVSPYSTVLNNEDYFSHRKEGGRTGRMLAVLGMRE